MSGSPDDKWNFVLEETRGLGREQAEAREAVTLQNGSTTHWLSITSQG